MAGRGPVRDLSKPNSRAYRDGGRRSVGLVELPAEGNPVEPPEMPTGYLWSQAEIDHFRDLWQSPQSTMWDLSAVHLVAVYVRAVHQCLNGRMSATLAAEVRQLADHLAVSPEGMKRVGWTIAPPADMATVVTLHSEAS